MRNVLHRTFCNADLSFIIGHWMSNGNGNALMSNGGLDYWKNFPINPNNLICIKLAASNKHNFSRYAT